MRPKPITPSVFSYSSVPEYFDRSHAPSTSARVRLRDVAREREQHPHRVLGGGDHVRLRSVRDDDAALGGGVHVDVVHPDAGAADRPQAVGLGDQVGVELRGRADQHAVELADPALELAVLPVDPELDLEAGVAQQLDAAVADLLLDEDARAGSLTAARRARRPRGTRAARRRRPRRARRRRPAP